MDGWTNGRTDTIKRIVACPSLKRKNMKKRETSIPNNYALTQKLL